MSITKIYDTKSNDEIFKLSSSTVFLNNPNVNTNFVDTFENHFVDFSRSKNVKFDNTDNSISLKNPTKEGFYLSKSIYSSQNGDSKLNDLYLMSSFLTENYTLSKIKPKIIFYIVTPKNEEFEISHVSYTALHLMKDIEYFSIKCRLIPDNEGNSPKVFGHSIHFKDLGVFNQNTTNI